MLKRITISLFCLFLILNCSTFSVFAEGESNVPDGYSPCGLNDQVDAFKSYCQSRNLIVEGSGLDVVTAFTTNAYQGAVKKVGLDINQLQNEIYKRTKDNVGAKWFFTQSGISAYNRIFAELLQNNDLEVGDSANQTDNTVYSGQYFVDNDGIGCLCYVSSNKNLLNMGFTSLGTPYKYTPEQIISLVGNGSNTFTFNLYSNTSKSYTLTRYEHYTQDSTTPYNSIYIRDGGNYSSGFNFYQYNEGTYYGTPFTRDVVKNGQFVIVSVWGEYWLCAISQQNSHNLPNGPLDYNWYCKMYYQLGNSSANTSNATVYFTTNNNVINNNNYEGDTYITNEGDVVTNEPEPTPGGQNPGWNVGGGQGSYNDGQGNNYTINFPDFELPDLNIDWSIQGLGNKFPFSIPFDIVSLVTVLNAEPEAPRFQGTVNFGFTTWDYDINLQQFDSVAQVCRIAELLLLVFSLILITRSIIKG